jgi:hypothetical protein
MYLLSKGQSHSVVSAFLWFNAIFKESGEFRKFAIQNFPKFYEGSLLRTGRHTQNNKDQGRRPVTCRREREKKRERGLEREGGAHPYMT